MTLLYDFRYPLLLNGPAAQDSSPPLRCQDLNLQCIRARLLPPGFFCGSTLWTLGVPLWCCRLDLKGINKLVMEVRVASDKDVGAQDLRRHGFSQVRKYPTRGRENSLTRRGSPLATKDSSSQKKKSKPRDRMGKIAPLPKREHFLFNALIVIPYPIKLDTTRTFIHRKFSQVFCFINIENHHVR